MTMATVGSRYQVVIPQNERKQIGLRPHSKVIVEARGNSVVLYQVPSNGFRGGGRSIANDTDATDYVKKLRSEWDGRQ